MRKTGTFTASGQSEVLSGRRITLRVAGFGTASVQPQTFLNDEWIDEGSAISADGTVEYTFVNPRPFRLDTSWSSGTITYQIDYEG